MTERDELLEALNAALAALENGASLESALAADPARAAELRPLLVAALSVGAGPNLTRVPAGAQAASRTQFLAGATDRRPAMVPVAGGGSRVRSWLAGWTMAGGSLLARAVAVGLVVLAGLGAGGYGAVAASAQSLPGDPLYGVKRTVETTELLLAADQQTRARLQTEFDDRRVREAQAVVNQGRQVPVEFTGTLISMDGAQSQHWLVSGVAVLVGPKVPVDGEPMVGAKVHIQGLVQTAGEVQAQRVTVLPYHAGPLDATPTSTATESMTWPATASATPVASATPTLTPVPVTAAALNTAAPTVGAPAATETRAATATHTSPPAPTETFSPTATDDHGGGPGPSASQTPEATEGGGDHGGSASQTPQPTENGDHGGVVSQTPEPTGGGGGPSPSNTPQPTDSGGGGSGPSPSNTPQPTDSGGGGSGPSPSNTPKPGD